MKKLLSLLLALTLCFSASAQTAAYAADESDPNPTIFIEPEDLSELIESKIEEIPDPLGAEVK